MERTTWLVFLGTEIVPSFVPGSAVPFVVALGLRAGTRAAMLASLGILAANALCVALSALGVAAVLPCVAAWLVLQ